VALGKKKVVDLRHDVFHLDAWHVFQNVLMEEQDTRRMGGQWFNRGQDGRCGLKCSTIGMLSKTFPRLLLIIQQCPTGPAP